MILPDDNGVQPHLSPLLRTLETAWSTIRRNHPDVPDAVIIIASGSRQASSLTRGHWAAGRWSGSGIKSAHEVMVAGELLADGPLGVLETLLHEAAHGLATSREIKDTSREGRYHNVEYKALAEEMGLAVERDGTRGWSITEALPDTVARYEDTLRDLDAAIRLVRAHESQFKTKKPARKTRVSLVCACGPERGKLDAAPGTLAKGDILCGVCGESFEPREDS